MKALAAPGREGLADTGELIPAADPALRHVVGSHGDFAGGALPSPDDELSLPRDDESKIDHDMQQSPTSECCLWQRDTTMDRGRILVVDDDPLITLETACYLETEGFDVTRADCATDAINAIDQRRSFAALVTDIDLGEGTDGFGVARQLRAIWPDLPVIFVSGSAVAQVSARLVSTSTFIAKPFQPHQIFRALVEASLVG